MSKAEVSNARKHLEKHRMVTVTCIIPTFQRPRTLLKALYSLQAQSLSEFEILVVDNAADVNIERLVNQFNQHARIPVAYLPEPQIGLHNARHTAVRAATGDILVFTDDDATFDSQWLQAYATAFTEHPEMAAAGGPVRPIWEEPPPTWLLEYINNTGKAGILSLMEPYSAFRLDAFGYFFGVNMAIRRYIVFEVGGFNPDSFGDIWLGDGECGFNRKLWEQKKLIGYIPTAIVYHHIPPHRMTVKYFQERMANQGACDMYVQYHQGIPPKRHLLKHIVQIILKNKLWIRPWFYRGRTDRHALDVQAHAARTQSHIKYVLRLLFQKDFQALVLKTNWLT